MNYKVIPCDDYAQSAAMVLVSNHKLPATSLTSCHEF